MHRRESNLKMKAEIGTMWPQATECWKPAEAVTGRKEFSPRASMESEALPSP